MALCDAASKGTPIPETLPPELGKAGAAIAAKPVAQESGGRLGLEEERRRNMEKGEYFLLTHFLIESLSILSVIVINLYSTVGGLKSNKCLRIVELAPN